MKWRAKSVSLKPRIFEIKLDSKAGYYIYCFEDGKLIADYLQDTLEIAIEFATEYFNVPADAWIKLDESTRISYERLLNLIKEVKLKIRREDFELIIKFALEYEWALGLKKLCKTIHEDDIQITEEYYKKLLEYSSIINITESEITYLKELIVKN